MATLRRGSEGPEVRSLQERLRELGHDTPGHFGRVTETAVIELQKARGLLPDGIVGPITRAALAEDAPGAVEPPEPPLPVDRTLRLPDGQFRHEVFAKRLLVLHHTAGASARSTFDWWATGQPEAIATAYIVARDGTIHEVFDPRLWAFHLGLAGTGGRVDRRSIGIEMASEGALARNGGRLLAFHDPDRPGSGTVFEGEVFEPEEPWRGVDAFAAYTPAQEASVRALADHLLDVFAIPRRTPADRLGFDRDLFDFEGVVGHHHLRADKTDLHPGFDWDALVETARLEEV